MCTPQLMQNHMFKHNYEWIDKLELVNLKPSDFHFINPPRGILAGDLERKPGVFREFIRFLYQSLFSITLGSVVWMTFISGALLSKSIPREQFRSVQSKMFPFFLKFVAGGELGLLLLYSIMSIRSKWQVLNLVALLASTCFNAFVLEPETTKVCITITCHSLSITYICRIGHSDDEHHYVSQSFKMLQMFSLPDQLNASKMILRPFSFTQQT